MYYLTKKEPKGGILRGLMRQGRRGLWVSKFCHRKTFPVTGRHFLSPEDISCHRKTFPVTERNFLSQEEISGHGKKFPVTGTISCQRKKFHLKRQNFKLQEEISFYKKKFPVTGRNFLLQEIIIYQRKKISAFIKRLTKLNQYFVLMTHCQ